MVDQNNKNGRDWNAANAPTGSSTGEGEEAGKRAGESSLSSPACSPSRLLVPIAMPSPLGEPAATGSSCAHLAQMSSKHEKIASNIGTRDRLSTRMADGTLPYVRGQSAMTAGKVPGPAPENEPGRHSRCLLLTWWGTACKQRRPAISGRPNALAPAPAGTPWRKAGATLNGRGRCSSSRPPCAGGSCASLPRGGNAHCRAPPDRRRRRASARRSGRNPGR